MDVKLSDYNLYRSDAVNFIVYVSGRKISKYTAEDLFHDAYINFSLNINKLNGNNLNVKGFIFSICKNMYYQHFSDSRHKSKYKDKWVHLEDLDIFDGEKERNADDLICFQVNNIDYNYYSGLISGKLKAVFDDHVKGYSNTEISQKYNINYYSVGTTINRARSLFIKKINPNFIKTSRKFR
jgi:RNA polymerase sigma factor (sigma-70 family)